MLILSIMSSKKLNLAWDMSSRGADEKYLIAMDLFSRGLIYADEFNSLIENNPRFYHKDYNDDKDDLFIGLQSVIEANKLNNEIDLIIQKVKPNENYEDPQVRKFIYFLLLDLEKLKRKIPTTTYDEKYL